MENGDWGHRMGEPMRLNVGGCVYTTTRSTLQRYPDSMLGAMFRGDFPTMTDAQGNYFIDRDGPLFRYGGYTCLLRKEADFYQIEPLIQCLGDPKPLLLYPTDTYEEVVELLSKYSNPVGVIITQLTITTKGFTIRNTRVHHMSERANENTVEHHWTFCRRTRQVND
ncbi:LOW QUALITY PROTEIN: BTB/POZ domain-containing protein KCTD6a [Polymixia lowei]